MSIAEKFEVIADAVYDKGLSHKEDEMARAVANAITRNGTRTEYSNNYQPFAYTDFSGFDFKGYLKPTGVVDSFFRLYKGKELPKGVDLSGVTSSNSMFSYIFNVGSTIVIPYMGLPALPSYTDFYLNTFAQQIELIKSTKDTTYTQTFYKANELVTVAFEGEIGQDISFQSSSKLSVETVIHILQHLFDYSGTEDEGKTITLHATVKARMANEGQIAELDNKTYDAYISDKGWTLA